MHRLTNFDSLPRALVAKWLLMAAIGGSINAGGFLACGRFVSHVTGFGTLFGIDVATANWQDAVGILTVPFWFLIGVMVSAYFTDSKLIHGRSPRYGAAMGLAAGSLFLVGIGGVFDLFGFFGASYQLRSDYVLLGLLCFASGLLNAVITTATNSVIRCTHLTGITTDLGIGAMRILFARLQPSVRRNEMQRGTLRVGLISAFCIGGAVGAMMFNKLHYLGFVLPGMLTIYVGNIGTRLHAAAVGEANAIAKREESAS